jgi:hypothetical protein
MVHLLLLPSELWTPTWQYEGSALARDISPCVAAGLANPWAAAQASGCDHGHRQGASYP